MSSSERCDGEKRALPLPPEIIWHNACTPPRHWFPHMRAKRAQWLIKASSSELDFQALLTDISAPSGLPDERKMAITEEELHSILSLRNEHEPAPGYHHGPGKKEETPLAITPSDNPSSAMERLSVLEECHSAREAWTDCFNARASKWKPFRHTGCSVDALNVDDVCCRHFANDRHAEEAGALMLAECDALAKAKHDCSSQPCKCKVLASLLFQAMPSELAEQVKQPITPKRLWLHGPAALGARVARHWRFSHPDGPQLAQLHLFYTL